MPRWLWFAPLAAFVMAVALLSYRQGTIAAELTETDVIETFTAYYVRTRGAPARPTDCVARPGATEGVWLVVSCRSMTGERFDYPVDRLGRLLTLEPAEEAPDVPRT